jgi:hypothetical protein
LPWKSRLGGGGKGRKNNRDQILRDYGLSWLAATSRSYQHRLGQMMENLPAVESWRETLSPSLRRKWASPAAVWMHSPIFANDVHPIVSDHRSKAAPATLNALSRLPAEEIARMLISKWSIQKIWAVRRSLDELLDASQPGHEHRAA